MRGLRVGDGGFRRPGCGHARSAAHHRTRDRAVGDPSGGRFGARWLHIGDKDPAPPFEQRGHARMAGATATKHRQSRTVRDRVWTHAVLGLITIAGCQLAVILDRSALLAEPLAVGLGYVALLYLAASLLVGPLYLTHHRRNPVNLFVRRDIGIWAGITALLHVLFSFQIFEQGQILLYFFSQSGTGLRPLLDLFGLSNDVGLLAALLVALLLVLSNDLSLRWLRGKRWKQIQRLAYPLLGLTILHTLGYQISNVRDGWYYWSLAGVTLVVLAGQGIGAVVHQRRETAWAQRRVAGGAAVTAPRTRPVVAPVGADDGFSRRRFLIAGGATLISGVVAGFAGFRIAEALLGPYDAAPALPAASAPPAPSPTPRHLAQAAAAPPAPAPATTAPAPATTAPAPAVDAPPTAPAAPTSAPTAVPPAALPPPPPTATAVPAAPAGPVLATLKTCPLNSALTFTAPDSGQSGILVHEADGSVKAFSNLCTHRPYPVQYDPNSQELVCPLHYALFSAQSGQVTQGPARRALAPMPVHVDADGNIIYG